MTWTQLPDDRSVFGVGGVAAVTVGGPGLVAVGEGQCGATVWVWAPADQ
ncbi:MAG: hypothetical protein ACE5MI_02685 [Acidimicrobiia bacterium]